MAKVDEALLREADAAIEDTDARIKALAEYLDCDVEDLRESTYGPSIFELGSKEYLVLTDSEADEHAGDYIKELLWAFNASFLASYTDLPEEIFKALQPQCEDANDAILKLVERSEGGLEGLINEAISADGRGHFLSHYDGNEDEKGGFFIYRLN